MTSHARQKARTNPNFWVRISSGGVGVFHVKGWGSKSSACPSKPRRTKLFGGMPWDLAGISGGCPKCLRKNVCVQFSSPNFKTRMVPRFFKPTRKSAVLGFGLDGGSLSFLSLVFWISLLKFKQGISLAILVFSLSFQRILWVRHGPKILGNFEVFVGKNPQKTRKGRTGVSLPNLVWGGGLR